MVGMLTLLYLGVTYKEPQFEPIAQHLPTWEEKKATCTLLQLSKDTSSIRVHKFSEEGRITNVGTSTPVYVCDDGLYSK